MSELIVEISKLSVAHRIDLIQAILATIALDASENIELTPAQIALIEQRASDLASGHVQAVPWEQVQAKLVARYGLPN